MSAWVILYCVLAAAGTWLARRYALHNRLLDHPGERRSHAVATPRGGGVAIVVALLVAAIALALRDPSQRVLLTAVGVGTALVAGIGMVDDHRPLSPWIRLLVHGLAGALFALAVLHVFGEAWLSILAFAATVGLANIWNFMDGIDGIAASQGLMMALALAAVSTGSWLLLAMALAAACLGFLPFNFPRARIFMGDVGSGAMGFAIAALAVVAEGTDRIAAMVLLLPLSAFLVDAGLTLLRRLLRRERWWEPHTQHAYQVWARRSGHAVVTLGYVAWTGLGMAVGAVVRAQPVAVVLGACVIWYAAAAVAWWILQRPQPADGRPT